MARRRGRSVFLYRHRNRWAIAERLAEAVGVTVLEVAPDQARGETDNRGGC
jgi:hypothetical protein